MLLTFFLDLNADLKQLNSGPKLNTTFLKFNLNEFNTVKRKKNRRLRKRRRVGEEEEESVAPAQPVDGKQLKSCLP